MNTQWYCNIGQQQYGPVPFEQLQQWAATGQLQPDHHVCMVGQQHWNLVRDVPGLLPPGANYPAAPAGGTGMDFNVGTGSSSYSAPRSSTSRSSGRPKNNVNQFRWGFAIVAGLLAATGGIARLVTLNEKRQEGIQQRQREVRRQQKISRPPQPPPATGPSIDMNELNREIQKSRLPPRPPETPKIPKF